MQLRAIEEKIEQELPAVSILQEFLDLLGYLRGLHKQKTVNQQQFYTNSTSRKSTSSNKAPTDRSTSKTSDKVTVFSFKEKAGGHSEQHKRSNDLSLKETMQSFS